MRRGPRGIPQRSEKEPRINHRIRKSPVRLIDEDGTQLGIVPLDDAKRRAQDKGLDLVEVGAKADPPVVRIMDWGKVKFDREKKARESRKKTQVVEVKEVKYRPTIEAHDFDIKTQRAIKFLKQGKKVKVTVFFRYRQLRRPELGSQILDKVTELTSDVGEVESRSRLEGRQMTMILAPLSSKSQGKEKSQQKEKSSSRESVESRQKVQAKG